MRHCMVVVPVPGPEHQDKAWEMVQIPAGELGTFGEARPLHKAFNGSPPRQGTNQELVLARVAEIPGPTLLRHLPFSKRPIPLPRLPPQHQIWGCRGKLQGFPYLLGICHIPKGFCSMSGWASHSFSMILLCAVWWKVEAKGNSYRSFWEPQAMEQTTL